MNFGPISNKVSNGTLAGFLMALTTGALEYFIPAWHHGIPGYASYLISAGVGAIGMFAGGYLSTHQATVAEINKALTYMQDLQKIVTGILGSNTPVPTVTVTGGTTNSGGTIDPFPAGEDSAHT